MWPHGLQPTRLLRPWDSLGKSTGAGCRCLLQCVKVKSEREVAPSCPTLSDPMDCSPPGPPSMGFSRQEYWSGVPLPSPKKTMFLFKYFHKWTKLSHGFLQRTQNKSWTYNKRPWKKYLGSSYHVSQLTRWFKFKGWIAPVVCTTLSRSSVCLYPQSHCHNLQESMS